MLLKNSVFIHVFDAEFYMLAILNFLRYSKYVVTLN